jgi:hypothetical protein
VQAYLFEGMRSVYRQQLGGFLGQERQYEVSPVALEASLAVLNQRVLPKEFIEPVDEAPGLRPSRTYEHVENF